jgi:hypothetical protein
MSTKTYKALRSRPEGVGTWTYLNIPMEISSTFNSKSQVKVKGTINGCSYRSTALPSGDGSHYLVVGKAIRDQIQVQEGDTVQSTMEINVEERSVVVPQGLEQALAGEPQAREVFVKKMSYSHQKRYLDWTESAKKGETRTRRTAKTADGLLTGKNIRDVR